MVNIKNDSHNEFENMKTVLFNTGFVGRIYIYLYPLNNVSTRNSLNGIVAH